MMLPVDDLLARKTKLLGEKMVVQMGKTRTKPRTKRLMKMKMMSTPSSTTSTSSTSARWTQS